MTSPRFTGPSEKMGTVHGIEPVGDRIDPENEANVHKTLHDIELGSLALLQSEFRIPGSPEALKASFIERENLGLGREDSRNDVRFGQVIFNGKGLHERPLLAAIKPFSNALELAPDEALSREWVTSNYLNSLSDRQLAYLPLGVWRNADDIMHLLSLYEHDVISYDNVFWVDKDLSPEALRPQVVEHAFADCIRGLGYLHGVGLVHRDSEAKNLASDRNGVRFIDLESAALLPRTGKKIEDSDLTTKMIRQDIETFFDSTMQVDENRPDVAKVLARPKADEKLAKLYRSGLRTGKKDSGLIIPDLSTSSVGYFKDTIDHALTVAGSK